MGSIMDAGRDAERERSQMDGPERRIAQVIALRDELKEARHELEAVKAQRDHECERANRFAEFIRTMDLTDDYHAWVAD